MRFLFFVLILTVGMSCSEPTKPTVKNEIPVQIAPEQAPISIYVYSKTNGYRHDNMDIGRGLMKKMADGRGWNISFTEDSLLIRPERLSGLDVLVFFNTTGDILGPEQEKTVEDYIKRGGGFLGIHAAADTEYDWPFYHDLVGAYFKSHPNDPNVREGVSRMVGEHPIAKDLPKDWKRMDEWYNYKSFKDHIQPIYNLDESSYEGGENGEKHPIAWCHDKFVGRAVYTGMGHTKESFSDPEFMQFLANSITWIAKR